MMEQTEQTLADLGVPFDGHGETKYEFDAEHRWWRRGMNQVKAVSCNDDGTVVTCAESIISALAYSAESADADEVRRRLREALPDTSYRDDPLFADAEHCCLSRTPLDPL